MYNFSSQKLPSLGGKDPLKGKDEGTIKINVDASFSDRGAFVGLVARNFKGIPLLVWTGRVNAFSPMEAETLAVRRGICIAKIKKWQRIIVEGDCKPVMEALSEGNSSPDWKLTPILEEISSIATTLFCFFCLD